MNDEDEIVCKNTYVNEDIVELPVYGQIKEAFYLHIKHVDYHSQEQEKKEDYENEDLRYTSSESEEDTETGEETETRPGAGSLPLVQPVINTPTQNENDEIIEYIRLHSEAVAVGVEHLREMGIFESGMTSESEARRILEKNGGNVEAAMHTIFQ